MSAQQPALPGMQKPKQPPKPAEAETKKIVWRPAAAEDRYEIHLQEGSVRPMSQEKLAKLAIELKKAGMIDIYHALDWIGVPDAYEISQAVEQELKLAALAKVTRK